MATLVSKKIDDVLIVGFGDGKLLDDSVIQRTSKELMATAAEAEDGQKVLLSFQGVSFMSSAMLGKLVLFLKKCRQEGVSLKVCSISPEIFEVFKLTKLNKVFDVYPDEKKAIESFNKKGWFG
jgi:anti-anti-sigma factor